MCFWLSRCWLEKIQAVSRRRPLATAVSSNARWKARDTSCIVQLKALQNALQNIQERERCTKQSKGKMKRNKIQKIAYYIFYNAVKEIKTL